MDGPEIRLKKGRRLSGTAVNERGEPVSGAHVSASFTTGQGPRSQPVHQQDCTLTDDRGRFTLLRTNPAGITTLSLTSDRGLMQAVEIDSSAPAKPKLVVTPKGMVTLVGRVINEDGEPVAGAAVHVSQAFNWISETRFGSAPAPLDTVLTDAEGRFQTTEPLPRTRKYRIGVSSPGTLPAGTEFLDYAADDPIFLAFPMSY